jgi:MYXO-CTERM domain-containing protein
MPGSSSGPTGYGNGYSGQPNLRAGQGNSCSTAGTPGGRSSPLAMIALGVIALLRGRRRLR